MPILDEKQLNTVHQFARSAEAYCLLLETHTDLTDEVFAIRCAELLAALYRDMLMLPEIDHDAIDWHWEVAKAIRYMKHSTNFYTSLYDRLNANQHDLYWLYFDPFDETSGLSFPLSMTLLEIYENLRRDVEFYRLGTERGFLYASYQWRISALVHWGQHLTDALRVLHEIIVTDWNKRPSNDQAEDEDDD